MSGASEHATHETWDVPRDIAIPRLLALHGGQLYGLGCRLCGNGEEAEDLVQETFLSAWRHWDQFEGRSEPFVWLYRIAHHACQRMHRKRAGQPDHLDDFDEGAAFAKPRVGVVDDADGLDEQIRREQKEAVESAITALPEEFRVALVLKEIVGFSVADVAQVLGIKEATVKTRLHRARLRVRAELERGLPEVDMPPAAYSRQVCMDLLAAKQDSMDRGVPMPNADEIICQRCEAFFATMDRTQEICHTLIDTPLPESLHSVLLEQMQEAG